MQRKRRSRLTKTELEELDSLYTSYYGTDVWGLRDFARMTYLEKKGTEAQIRELLEKHGVSYDREFS